VLSSRTLLEVVLTNADTGLPEVVTNRDPNVDLYEAIRATAALPALYNRRVRIGDSYYIDGGFVDAVPVEYAVEKGASVVVAVLTRQTGYRRTEKGSFYKFVGRALARGQSSAVKALIGLEDPRFNRAMEILEGRAEKSVRPIVVWPSIASELVSRTTSDRSKLLACAEMGRRDMLAALERPIDSDDTEAS